MSFFTNGGAEANENAIKLARWYTGRHKIIARYRSYHGATAGAITLTGDPRRWAAEPGLPGVVRMFDPYTYRCPAGHPDPCPVCTGAPHLEEILQYEGAHTVAAVILETVTGTNGIIVPPDGYLQSIREVCDRHGILLICDEVMAGFGRTGKWFAVDNWDVVPDILTVAKGINSGYVPLGAMIVREPIAEWVRDKYFAGGLTYSGHPLACASAVASIEAFQEEGIVENAAAMGEVFRAELAQLAEKHPSIGEVRGLGCFWGLELVKNRETREPLVPFNGSRRGGEADGGGDEARARQRPVPDDALERRHVLPAADDHPRGARRGASRSSTTRSRSPTSSSLSRSPRSRPRPLLSADLQEFARMPGRVSRAVQAPRSSSTAAATSLRSSAAGGTSTSAGSPCRDRSRRGTRRGAGARAVGRGLVADRLGRARRRAHRGRRTTARRRRSTWRSRRSRPPRRRPPSTASTSGAIETSTTTSSGSRSRSPLSSTPTTCVRTAAPRRGRRTTAASRARRWSGSRRSTVSPSRTRAPSPALAACCSTAARRFQVHAAGVRTARSSRARWDEAAARGTPALVVQAQETSRPILERCGFEVVCTMYEVEHDPL